MQWDLIEAGTPIPSSIPYEEFKLDTGSSYRKKDEIRAVVSKALMQNTTPVLQETMPVELKCERCGRAAHLGGCRF